MDPEKIFLFAEEAVGFVVRDIRPDLAYTWRGVTAKDIGIEADDWLKMSARMIRRFNANAELNIAISEPTRAPYRTKRFIAFSIAIADMAL